MEIRVDYGRTKEFVKEIFLAKGLPADFAERVSDNLLSAELRGVKSHGLVQVSRYADLFDRGIFRREGEPEILRESSGTLLIDGHHIPGAVTGVFAMDRVIEKAKSAGIALASVRGGTHFGMAAYYAMRALPENMIGFAFCNAGVLVAPYGGIDPALGTNPICAAVPAGRHQPIVVDEATSVQAINKCIFAMTEGRRVPEGWGIAHDGKPTEDPEQIVHGGALLPFGGYKGYGLGVMVNVLTGILSGASALAGADGILREDVDEVGFCFAAIDIAKFGDPAVFRNLVDLFIDRIKSGRKAEGVSEILIPGEPEFRNEADGRKNGIPVYSGVQTILTELGKNLRTEIQLPDCIVRG